jgi:hypothetical protein
MTSENFLHVDLIVAEGHARTFELAMGLFLYKGGFGQIKDGADEKPFLSLKSTKTFPYRGYGRFPQTARPYDAKTDDFFHDNRIDANERVFRYVHLWDVPDLGSFDLPDMMQRCAENKYYLLVDSFVIREIQNFVKRFGEPSGETSPDATSRVVRVVRQFAAGNLGKYLFKLRSVMPMLEQKGWHQIVQLQNITGSVNGITEFYSTRQGQSIAAGPASLYKLAANVTSPDLRDEMAERVEFLETLPTSEVRETFCYVDYLKEYLDTMGSSQTQSGA